MGHSEKQSTILVVDDSAAIRNLLTAYLRKGGYRVVEAVDGQAGLESCLQRTPDLILLDIVMPEMDGFSLCARLQNDVNLYQVPIIMLSSLDDTESKMRSFELGAVDYITKPVSKGELLARIKTHLTINRLTYSLHEANRELLVNQHQLLQGLHAAADLQKNLLPKHVPDCKELRFASYFNPCQEVGGDIYNIQRLDSEHLAIYILDVSGHGFPAAMMTALATQALSGASTIVPPKYDVKEEALSFASPDEVVWELNKEFPIDRFNLFITIIYLLFNTRDFSFRYCCAGHPPLVHVTSEGKVNLLDTGGAPVGMNGTWNAGEGYLERGDRLFFYTDGLSDYSNDAGEFYGQKRLVESMEKGLDLPLQTAVKNIIGELKKFGGQVDADDDMTLLAVERK